MVICTIDDIPFKLTEYQDFTWLKKYGKVFKVFDETGSGSISFCIERNNKKYFFKIAGAKTVFSEQTAEDTKKMLQKSEIIYQHIHHPNLIKYIGTFEYKEFYCIIFEYAGGECLLDYWNNEKYENNEKEISPMNRFKKLPISKKINVIDKLFSFFETVVATNYVAVDFSASNIVYNFDTDEVTFCDLDLFEKQPFQNKLGEEYPGRKEIKSPEEKKLNAKIDELTNEFTLGTIIFDIFSNVKNNNQRKEKGMFIHSSFSDFELSKELYDILTKATSYNREKRYKTIKEFHQTWNEHIIKYK